VPLARVTDGPRSAIIIVSLALLRLHVSVDRMGDGRIGAACFVLVDDAAASAQQLLTVFETRAIPTARPTKGSADLIITA
jgi:hypothetical protein